MGTLVFRRFFPALSCLFLVLALVSSQGAVSRAEESPLLAPAPFAVPPAGTRLVFEDLDSGEQRPGIVKQARGYIVRWSWQGRINQSLTHFCQDCLDAGLGASGGPLQRLYPLEKGKGIRFNIQKGADKVWENEILVIGTERVETPVGTFDCYVVRRRVKAADDSWRGEQRHWYAPALGWVIRFESFDTSGRKQRWRLVDYD